MTLELVEQNLRPEFSAIVAVSDVARLADMLTSYRAALDAPGRSYELICVTDGREGTTMEALHRLASDWPELVVLGQHPWSDDDAALLVGVKRARSDLVLTLPGWPEIDTTDLPTLFEALGDSDMVIAARSGRDKGGLRRTLFHGLLKRLFGLSVDDPFCRVRLARKPVLEDAGGLGVRQHFIPSIAAQRGYQVTEAQLRPAAAEEEAAHGRFVFKPLGHVRAVLDALMLFVVLKFLRRPMRFFGAIGVPILLVGLATTAVLVAYRLFGATALADRPVLIFAVLMVVLGIQIIGLGLVGEIIIFAQSRRMKQYTVRSIQREDADAIAEKTKEAAGSPPQRAGE
ncbi:glycosyl transferase family 2 [Ruegeria sp. 2012CJ41-6]|uniref:Glycosyl transferase family 2 n=1 Tax=Ruegeria spongiae TaxID=2942209 RepID=A0ABT0Q6Y7_9RHOB|nr:glycosyl transferase family 2 [Ruegeria spongiae]MCL6285640.1 glycosyl transferase family 2 [Ruegeria spongiae]